MILTVGRLEVYMTSDKEGGGEEDGEPIYRMHIMKVKPREC